MKKLVKKVTYQEVDFQLPYYFKNHCHAYAILDENTSIMVCYGYAGGESVSNYSGYIDLAFNKIDDTDVVEITSSEFKDLYHETIAKINSIFN